MEIAIAARYDGSQLFLAGMLDERIEVICDPYCSSREPVLLGFVSPNPAERRAAIVKTGDTTYDYGVRPGYDRGWKTIGDCVRHASMIPQLREYEI